MTAARTVAYDFPVMKRPDDIAREGVPTPGEPLGTEHRAYGTVTWWQDAKGRSLDEA